MGEYSGYGSVVCVYCIALIGDDGVHYEPEFSSCSGSTASLADSSESSDDSGSANMLETRRPYIMRTTGSSSGEGEAENLIRWLRTHQTPLTEWHRCLLLRGRPVAIGLGIPAEGHTR